MRIYLTGFMASGKSSVGPRLAARLGSVFWDLDRLIRAHDGRSIPTIFEEEGEEAFREQEAHFLRRTMEVEDLVVALGGGALVVDDNWAFAREHGRVVYLEVDPETIRSRVEDEADQRPLLQDDEGQPLSRERMQRQIDDLLSTRQSRYEAAHATVDATGTVSEVTQAVFEEAQARGWA
jgi:shikimate kinase